MSEYYVWYCPKRNKLYLVDRYSHYVHGLNGHLISLDLDKHAKLGFTVTRWEYIGRL